MHIVRLYSGLEEKKSRMASSQLGVGAMNLLDIIAATEAKEKAIAAVATNTNPDWWQACYNIIATTTNTFTTDDIWQALEDLVATDTTRTPCDRCCATSRGS
jgi:hypothetical protein